MTEKGEEMRINVHNWIMLQNDGTMLYNTPDEDIFEYDYSYSYQ